MQIWIAKVVTDAVVNSTLLLLILIVLPDPHKSFCPPLRRRPARRRATHPSYSAMSRTKGFGTALANSVKT